MESFEKLGKQFQTDKIHQHGYHRFYPLFLEKYRKLPITMLEIGIAMGKSFLLWKNYFPQAAIYGIDNSKSLLNHQGKIFNGQQADLNFLAHVVTEIGRQVELVIDDGSHKPEDQIQTFSYLFTNLVAPGGTYIIEDIETSYWKNGFCYGNHIKKGYQHPESTVEIFKKCIDGLNDEFMLNKEELDRFPIPYSVIQLMGLISFQHNSIIILKKEDSFTPFNNRTYRFEAML